MTHADVRRSLRGVVESTIKLVILVPLVTFAAYVGSVVLIASRLGLWNDGLAKDTAVWFLLSGVVLFAGITRASEEGYFRRKVRGALGVGVFVEVYLNLASFPLIVEMVIQPAAFLLAGVSIVSRGENQKEAKRAADGLLAILGLGLFVGTAIGLAGQGGDFDWGQALLTFALPVWLSLSVLPFVYFMSLYLNYDMAFRRMSITNSQGLSPYTSRVALILGLHMRNRDVHGFVGPWLRKLAVAPTFQDARQVVGEYRASHEAAAEAKAKEAHDLRRYIGAEGTDAEGRRLDRREFKVTTRALEWLSSCQMGWFRNRGQRYHREVVDVVAIGAPDLPADHGITVTVRPDGQAWFAWRRTVTGWCFAIGAEGAPPDQRFYDGPEPPIGFPGEDSAWEMGPFERSTNW